MAGSNPSCDGCARRVRVWREDLPQPHGHRTPHHWHSLVWPPVLWAAPMKTPQVPCAIYTRKSSEEGLEQGFNSLDAQREACAAFILSQRALGWLTVSEAYDDGGFS